MSHFPRKAAFVLAASDHGTMIVSRLDYAVAAHGSYGVGFGVLEHGSHERTEVEQLLFLLGKRRVHFGDGVVAVDCGANIGVHTVEWGKHMTGWGSVVAIEPQERIFYALAGNIALNNCMNARAIRAAVGAVRETIRIPVPDYLSPANLGGLELRETARTEAIGQRIDYSDSATTEIDCITLDSLGLRRLDLMKIDVEGMEVEAIEGARAAIAAHLPIIMAEHMKSGWDAVATVLQPFGYTLFRTPMNVIAVHPSDPTSREIVQA